MHQSFVRTELVEATSEVPLFGGVTREVVPAVPQPVIGEDGRAERVTRFVGLDDVRNAARVGGLAAALTGGVSLGGLRREATKVEVCSALEFTLLPTALTNPAILALGANWLARPRGAPRSSSRCCRRS